MINDYHRDLDRIVENSKKKIVKAVKDKKVLKENADLILTFVEKHRPKGQRLKLHTVNRHLINLRTFIYRAFFSLS